MSETTTICADCGHAVPTSVLGGLCPFCLASSVADELESRTPVGPVVVGPASYEQIGPYRILDRLGEGGYGVVYRAEQERPLRRMVAIKIMKGGVVSEQAVARFEAERQALAMMEHPSIAHVYDVGETEEGLPYFVMELIEGVPITTYCEANALSRDERLRLFQHVCEAVAHAHRRGIIHRDLKPSNILVTAEGGTPLPKVIDFGIAKATETLLTERTLVTRDHQLVGTPAYMSPEQAAMTGGDVDIRADIYSLGVVLYELLTGTTPFRIEKLATLPYDEALRKVRTEDPQRPSSRIRERGKSGEFRKVTRGEAPLAVSTDLDWIVMKALEKEPERRYETAGALSRDLARFLKGEAIKARPPTRAYVVGKFVRKHRGPVLAAAAVLVAMVVGTIVSLTMFFRAEAEAGRAGRNEERAEEQAELAAQSDLRRMLEFSHSDMAKATPLLDDGRPSLAVALLARALRTHPRYGAAATRLLYTIASENWARPHRPIPLGAQIEAAFSADGSRVIVLYDARSEGKQAGRRVEIFDIESGGKLSEVPVDDGVMDLEVSPDGEVLAVLTPKGTIERWKTGKEREALPEFVLPEAERPAQLRYSPDGRFLACTRSGTGALQVLDATSGTLVSTISVPDARGGIGAVHFTPDGSRVVVSFAKSLAVFASETGERVGEPMTHEAVILGVAALPDGERVVSWAEDRTARVWNATTGEAGQVFHHEARVACGALSPDGTRLLTGTGEHLTGRGMVRLWDVHTGELIGAPHLHPGPVKSVQFSADGTRAASGSLVTQLGDGAVQVMDAWTGKALMAPIFHPRGARKLAFSPDGTKLAVSSRHHELVVWSLPASAMRSMHLPHKREVWRAVFDHTEGRNHLLTQSFGGETRRYDAETGELLGEGDDHGPDTVLAHAAVTGDSLRQGLQARRELLRFIPHVLAPRYNEQGCVRVAAATDDGTLLVTGCFHGSLRIWSLATGELVRPAVRHTRTPDSGGADRRVRDSGGRDRRGVTALAIDASGTRLASGDWKGEVNLWSLPDGELLRSVQASDTVVSALAFAPDGETIAIGGEDGVSRFWRPGSEPSLGPVMQSGNELGKRVNHLAFNPAGTLLAVSGEFNAARMWDVASGQAVGPEMAHIDISTYGLFLFWSPDGQRLITTGSHDNMARVWRVETGQMATNPLLHPLSATAAALRPGGDALLFGGRSARIWDLGSGEPLTPLLGQDGGIYSAAFDENTPRFATATVRGSAYLCDFVEVSGPLPGALTGYAAALGGFWYNEEGVLEQVGIEQWRERQEEVARLGAGREDAVGVWMRWLADEPGDARTISPYSKVTMKDHVDRLVRDDTPASLREALLLKPGDALIMGKLGYRLVTQPEPGVRDMLYGGFLVRRAVQLAPENAALQWMRGLVVLQEKIRGVGPGK